MLRSIIFNIFIYSGFSVLAQLPNNLQHNYSVTYDGQADSLLQRRLLTLDSIQHYSEKQYVVIKDEYDSIDRIYTELSNTFQQKSDSLNALTLPTGIITSKIDSIQTLKEQKLSAIKAQADELKQSCIQKIEQLDLPEEINVKVKGYTNSLDKLDISVPKTEINFPYSQFEKITRYFTTSNEKSVVFER